MTNPAEPPAGPGSRALANAAQKFNADLIVVAGREVAITADAVSQYVLRRAPCPVLVVPSAAGTSRERSLPRSDGP